MFGSSCGFLICICNEGVPLLLLLLHVASYTERPLQAMKFAVFCRDDTEPYSLSSMGVGSGHNFILLYFRPVAILARPLASQDEMKGPPVAEGGLL